MNITSVPSATEKSNSSDISCELLNEIKSFENTTHLYKSYF